MDISLHETKVLKHQFIFQNGFALSLQIFFVTYQNTDIAIIMHELTSENLLKIQ